MVELKQVLEKLKSVDGETLVELHREYGIDRVELSKVLIIASTTLLVVSIHSALSFQDAYKKVSETEKDLRKAEGILESQSFQEGVNALENVQGAVISRSIDSLVNSLKGLEDSIEKIGTARENLKKSYRIYQWLALIAILGEIAGVSLIYL